MVCVMLQAVYTTAEKEFRSIVFFFFFFFFMPRADTKELPYVRKDETTWYFIQLKGKGLQSRGLF